MTNAELKKMLKKRMETEGFTFQRNKLYFKNSEVIIIISIQKSKYEDSYYINYGFILPTIHKEIKNLQINDCDIMGRFINTINDKVEFDFQLSYIGQNDMEKCIEENIWNTIMPVLKHGIGKYFELYPKAIFAAKKSLKEYLEVN